MIVPFMTPNEVYKEVMNDYEYVSRKSLTQVQLAQKEMLRKGIEQQSFSITCKTPRRNEWNILCKATREGTKKSYYIKSADKVGLVAYSLLFNHRDTGEMDIYLMKYYKHFFDRYNQRMALGFNETSKTIKHFFKNNFEFTLGETDIIENNIACSPLIFAEGLGMSWKNEDQKTYHVKTFVAAHMFTTGQRELVQNLTNDEEGWFTIKLEHLKKAV
jgi:hypothetical protein